MDLLSVFKRAAAPSAASAAGEPVDAVQRARTRARQRLIGATVLLVGGVIGFPLVFETQPRPIPVDIQIDVPRKESAAPLVMPAARAPAVAPSAAPAVTSTGKAGAPAAKPAAPNDVITETAAEAGREVPPRAAAGSAAGAPGKPVATAKPVAAAPVKAAAAMPEPVSRGDEGARVKALLEGKPPAAAADVSERFVVQVGAFADAGAAREMRLKAEKLGLKTYTQVVNTAAGNRIRVRIGPFTQRDEADKALAKARGAGLAAAVLTL